MNEQDSFLSESSEVFFPLLHDLIIDVERVTRSRNMFAHSILAFLGALHGCIKGQYNLGQEKEKLNPSKMLLGITKDMIPEHYTVDLFTLLVMIVAIPWFDLWVLETDPTPTIEQLGPVFKRLSFIKDRETLWKLLLHGCVAVRDLLRSQTSWEMVEEIADALRDDWSIDVHNIEIYIDAVSENFEYLKGYKKQINNITDFLIDIDMYSIQFSHADLANVLEINYRDMNDSFVNKEMISKMVEVILGN